METITMPQLGESVTEGTVEKWLVQPGDYVKKYEAIAEVISDKVSAEIPSSFSGTIGQLLVQEGTVCTVGEAICTIETEANETPPSPQKTPADPPAPIATETTFQRYSPAVRKLIEQHKVNVSALQGTGAGGRVTKKDVEQAIASGTLPAPVAQSTEQLPPAIATPPAAVASDSGIAEPPQTSATQQPVSAVRRAIAQRMTQSTQEIPHAWMMVEVDVTALVAYRNQIKDAFLAREGYPLTYFAFYVKAVAQALQEFPMMNASWRGDYIEQHQDIHISIAVATDDALFVPVIRHADEQSVKGIARQIHTLAERARAKQLSRDDVSGGTFTVNNTGAFGSVQSMGIINYPQAAILQVETITKKSVLIQGDAIAIRSIGNICLSFDHRILDGLICGKLVSRVKELLENSNFIEMSVY